MPRIKEPYAVGFYPPVEETKPYGHVGFYPLVGDLLHVGHLLAIEEAAQHCDKLIVGLNCAPDGKSPIQTIYERFMQLRAIKGIDEIIPYGGKADMEKLAATLNYDVRFLGEDYRDIDWDGKEIEKKRGIVPYFIERSHNLSSTELKLRITKEINKPIK